MVNGNMLSGNTINAAQTLLKYQYSLKSGLQKGQKMKFDSILVQSGKILSYRYCILIGAVITYSILNCIGGNHWICTCSNELGVVKVLDSLSSSERQIADETVLQICNIYTLPDRIKIRRLKEQQQIGSLDCGLFAIAFAAELCEILGSLDLEKVIFKQLKYDETTFGTLH